MHLVMTLVEASLREFVSRQQRLLELELRSEEEEDQRLRNLENINDGRLDGYVLRGLEAISTSVGLYGRTVVTLSQGLLESSQSDTNTLSQPSRASAASKTRQFLQAHRLTVGDEVEILPKNGKGVLGGSGSRNANKLKRVCGVVCAVDDLSISVALFGGDVGNRQQYPRKDTVQTQGKKNVREDEDADDDGDLLGGPPPYSLVPKSSAEVHQKMVSALEDLERLGVNHPIAGNIVKAAFEPQSESKLRVKISRREVEALEDKYNLSSTKLDYSQKEAVAFVLSSEFPISLVHGPPGTGS